MKITLYLSDKKREHDLGDALTAGFVKHGDTVERMGTDEYRRPDWETQLAVVVGCKGRSKAIFDAYRSGARHVMLVDKSYFARGVYHRCTIDGFQSHYAHNIPRPDDRWKQIQRQHRIDVKPARKPGGEHIVYAGSSQKVHDWHGLGDASDFAEATCHAINKQTHGTLPLYYRPKPSWAAGHAEDVRQIPHTIFSPPNTSLADLLPGCAALVTHCSNAATDAVIAGVPAIVLHPEGCGAGAVSSGSKIELLQYLLEPDFMLPFPTDAQRWQWLSDLAYVQFTPEEMESGLAWAILAPNTMRAGLQDWASLPPAEAVIAQYRAMHESPKMFRGQSIRGNIEALCELVAKHRPATLLDYGSGKGAQYSEWKVHDEWGGPKPTCYDPGVAGIDAKPQGQFDGVICTDVMEHVLPDDVEQVFAEAIGYGRKFAFFCIFTEPSRKFLPDGRNCHLTCRSAEWWVACALRLTGGAVERTFDVAKPIAGGGFEKCPHWLIRAPNGAEVMLTFRSDD